MIGRSNIVGKPMALLLLQADATVTVCHSRTPDLGEHTRRADVVVAAVGRANTLTADMVKPGAVVIDVGMNRNADGKLCGDVDFAGVAAGRRRDHAGAGRRRADDDRDAALEHRRRRRARRRRQRALKLIRAVAGRAKL